MTTPLTNSFSFVQYASAILAFFLIGTNSAALTSSKNWKSNSIIVPADSSNSLRDSTRSAIGPPKLIPEKVTKNPQDTSIALTARKSRKGRFYMGIETGVAFMDFKQKTYFNDDAVYFINHKFDIDTALVSSHNSGITDSDTITAQKSKLLQPYNPVMVTFPTGCFLAVRISENMDLFINAAYFQKEQQAIVEISEPGLPGQFIIANKKLTYVIQGYLGGTGIRLHLPPEFITIKKEDQIFLDFLVLWDIGYNEIYSDYGVARSNTLFKPLGYNFAMGFQTAIWRGISIYGSISFFAITIKSNQDWGRVVLMPAPEALTYDFNALRFNFQFAWYFGGNGSTVVPVAAQP